MKKLEKIQNQELKQASGGVKLKDVHEYWRVVCETGHPFASGFDKSIADDFAKLLNEHKHKCRECPSKIWHAEQQQ